jgi:hypothetical protein
VARRVMAFIGSSAIAPCRALMLAEYRPSSATLATLPVWARPCQRLLAPEVPQPRDAAGASHDDNVPVPSVPPALNTPTWAIPTPAQAPVTVEAASAVLDEMNESLFARLREADRGNPATFVASHDALVGALRDAQPIWLACATVLRDHRARRGQRAPCTNGLLRQARHTYVRGEHPELYAELLFAVLEPLAALHVHNAEPTDVESSVSRQLSDTMPTPVHALRAAYAYDFMVDADVLHFAVAMPSKQRRGGDRDSKWAMTRRMLHLALALLAPAKWAPTLKYTVQAAVYLAEPTRFRSHSALIADLMSGVECICRLHPRETTLVEATRAAVHRLAAGELAAQVKLLRVPSTPLLSSILDAAVVCSSADACANAAMPIAAAVDAIAAAADVHVRDKERGNSVHAVLRWLDATVQRHRPLDHTDVVVAVQRACGDSFLCDASAHYATLAAAKGVHHVATWTCGCGARCSPWSLRCTACAAKRASADTTLAWTCPGCDAEVDSPDLICEGCACPHPWSSANAALSACLDCRTVVSQGLCRCAPSERLRLVEERGPGPLSAMRLLGGVCPACGTLQNASAWTRRCCASCGDVLSSASVSDRLQGLLPMRGARWIATRAGADFALRNLRLWGCGECRGLNLEWMGRKAAAGGSRWTSSNCSRCLSAGRVSRAQPHSPRRFYVTWLCGCGAHNSADRRGCQACGSAAAPKRWTCPRCHELADGESCGACSIRHPLDAVKLAPRLVPCSICDTVTPVTTPDGRACTECVSCANAVDAAGAFADGGWTCAECGRESWPLDAAALGDPLRECRSCNAPRPPSAIFAEPQRCETCGAMNEGFACGECGTAHRGLAAAGVAIHLWRCGCGQVNNSWDRRCAACGNERLESARNIRREAWRCRRCAATNGPMHVSQCTSCRAPRDWGCSTCGASHDGVECVGPRAQLQVNQATAFLLAAANSVDEACDRGDVAISGADADHSALTTADHLLATAGIV